MLCWVFGAHLVSHTRVASTSAASLVVDEVSALRAGIADPGVFAKEISHDRFRDTPRQPAADRPARQGRHPRVRRGLRQGRGPGLLCLATGRCCSRQRDQAAAGRRLLLSERLPHLADVRRHQLAGALHPALGPLGRHLRGATTSSSRPTASHSAPHSTGPGGGPSMSCHRTTVTWPEGSSFYHFDKLYDRRNVGYQGPPFAYASMPDQYALAALQRLELARPHRSSPLRGGRPGVEPHAVDPHPAADRLAPGR